MDAFAAIGIRDVQGSGVLAAHARVEDIAAGDLDALCVTGALLEVLSARGTATLVPAEDFAVFTLGTLPADEESLRSRLKPFLPVLDNSGYAAVDALEAAKEATAESLAEGSLDIGRLSGALTRALPELSPMCRGRCKVAHIDQGLFDLVGESGLWRHDRSAGERTYVAMDAPTDREVARGELLRRYLRCYGPSTPGEFAEWCGISNADAAHSFTQAETVDVDRRRHLLAEDVELLDAPPRSQGVRLLPPRDPYLLDRDRNTLIPDRYRRHQTWRAIPIDGLVLVDGAPVATWRPKKTRQHLTVAVEPFDVLERAAKDGLEQEATTIAPLRGCSSSEVALR